MAEIEIPPPFDPSAKPKDWRNPPPPLSFGHHLLNQVAPQRVELFPEQMRAILAIEREELLVQMVNADLLDPTNPNMMSMEKVFGQLLTRDFNVPALIMTWQFYCLAQAMACIEDGRRLCSDKSLTALERLNGYKTQMEAVRGMSSMVGKIQSLAKRLGCIKVPVGKKKSAPKVARILRPAPSLAPTERISVGLETPQAQ